MKCFTLISTLSAPDARRVSTQIVAGWQGRVFEDFEPGDGYQHPLGRTVNEADNTWATLLTMNTNQTHFNARYAETLRVRGVARCLDVDDRIAVGQSVTDVTQNVFANLQMDDVKLSQPVFARDTLWSESVVLSKRESGSRAQAGIVTVHTRTLNQDGDEVSSFRRTSYVYKQGAPQLRNVFPADRSPIDAGL
jgi:itaconyl-CoA hydratase